MKRSHILTLGGATVALALTPTAALAAGGAKVTVRIEGSTRTLLAATPVQTHTGSITKAGAPAGACPATSAAGALDLASKSNWTGKFYSSFNDYLISSILGDAPNAKVGYWGIWVDNRYATVGACEIKLKRGDAVLFAVDSVKHHEHPLGLSGPATATKGQSLKLKVVSYSDAGQAKPLAGAHLTGTGSNLVTNRQGVATITSQNAGKLRFTASDSGYIRSTTLTVNVSG
jgi:hypothetical protein